MSYPSFVHLRLHSEFSIVDSTVRIDAAVAAAKRDGMPALALTDLSNAFGLIKFYKAARAAGIKPIAGCDVWITHDAERDAPFRAILLAANRTGYLRLCDWLSRAYRTNQHRGRAELRREWFAEGTDGLIALSGARQGDVGGALVQGNAAGAAKLAREWSAWFPQRYYLEVQRAGHAEDEALVGVTVALAAELQLPIVATHPIQFLAAEDFRPHEARVCIAEGHVLSDTRRPRRFTTEQRFLTQAEMAQRFADLPEALANSVAIAQRCNLAITLGQNHLPEFPTPAGVTIDEHLRNEATAGLERRLERLYPDAAQRDAKRPEYVDAAGLRDEDHRADGLRRLLPDRGRLHRLGAPQPGAGRSGPRLGRGLARRVRARHHRSRSVALRADLRALPESRAGVDARLRHRLLPGRPRPRHRLRQAEVRQGFGVADRHVRHAGREGRGARRRPRARPALPVRRRHRQAHPVPAGQARDAEAAQRRARGQRHLRARGRAAAERARGGRRGSAAAPGTRRAARRPAAQRRHARGRRADRAGQAHRLLPALRAAGRRGDAVAVRQGRRRGGGPREVRLPGPHHADDPRLDRALHPHARPGGGDRPRPPAARRSGGVRHLPQGEHHRGVPVRIARHARIAEAGAGVALRGHHRAGRAVPAGADGADSRLHRAQVRPRAQRLSRPAPGTHPRRDVRRDGVPGTRDEDRAGDRRLHDGRRRPAAQGDGQEEARGDGQASHHLRRGRHEERRDARQGHAAVRPDGEVRGLRLQQGARGGVCAGGLPDRLLQGAPSGRVHGGEPVARDGRHRQGAHVPRRRDRPGSRGAAARHQRVELPLRAGGRQVHPVRTRRHQGHRARRRSKPSSRRARRAARSATSSTSAGAWTSVS